MVLQDILYRRVLTKDIESNYIKGSAISVAAATDLCSKMRSALRELGGGLWVPVEQGIVASRRFWHDAIDATLTVWSL